MQATPTGPDASGWLQMTGRNVVVPEDTLTVWTDARTRQTRRVEVRTSYQGGPAQLTATFDTLSNGLTYVARAVVVAPAKELSVQVENFNYTRPN